MDKARVDWRELGKEKKVVVGNLVHRYALCIKNEVERRTKSLIYDFGRLGWVHIDWVE